MSRAFPELDVFKVEVGQYTREQHLAAVRQALAARPRRGGRKLLAIAVATVFLLPVVALAAERAEPGDLLYPLKRALVEPVVSIFDSDVAAKHRVEEVEDLFAHEAEAELIERHIATARNAAADSPDLLDRIARVEAAVDDQASDETPPVDEGVAGATSPSDTEIVPETATPPDSIPGDDPPPRDGRGDRSDVSP